MGMENIPNVVVGQKYAPTQAERVGATYRKKN